MALDVKNLVLVILVYLSEKYSSVAREVTSF